MTIRVAIVDGRRLMGQLLRNLIAAEPDMTVVGMYRDRSDLLTAVERGMVDVVVLSVTAVPTTELDLVSRVRSLRPHTRVVTMVGARQEQYLAALVRAGATGHISEAADASELVDAIRASAHGETSISRDLAVQLLDGYAHPRHREVDLTARERSVLNGIIEGDSNREIALRLGLAEKTVKNHVTSIFDKLGVRDRTQAAVYALQAGLVSEGSNRTDNTKPLATIHG